MYKIIEDFLGFILKGNVLDLAIGVIIGKAFNSMVNALVDILLSIFTFAVPGGLKGLITILPAINKFQKGFEPLVVAPSGESLGQKFKKDSLQELSKEYAKYLYNDTHPKVVEMVKRIILSKYVLHGQIYAYQMSSVIDWGSFFNSIISFLIISITLFLAIKISAIMKEKAKQLELLLIKNKEKEETKKDGKKDEKLEIKEESNSKTESKDTVCKSQEPLMEENDKTLMKKIKQRIEENNNKLNGTNSQFKEIIELLNVIKEKLNNMESEN